MRVALYTDSTMLGGAERSAANLLGALPAEIEITVVGTDERVVAAICAQRPHASSILLPLVRAPWDAAAACARPHDPNARRGRVPDQLPATVGMRVRSCRRPPTPTHSGRRGLPGSRAAAHRQRGDVEALARTTLRRTRRTRLQERGDARIAAAPPVGIDDDHPQHRPRS